MKLADAPNSGHRIWPIQSQVPGVGRITNYAETLIQVFTKSAWRCYQGLLDPAINPLGWGIDQAFPNACLKGRVAILDMFTQTKNLQRSYLYPAAKAQADAYWAKYPIWNRLRVEVCDHRTILPMMLCPWMAD